MIGSYLLKILLENGYKVFVLARNKEKKSAQERVAESLRLWDQSSDYFKNDNLVVINGDVGYSNFNISSEETIEKMLSQIEIITHVAALTSFTASIAACRKANVEGTKNILDFALRCKRLQKVNHISTIFVVGNKENIDFSEDVLNVGQGFNNAYEQSKYEAELVVKDYQAKGIKISIFRPGAVIGDSKEGKTISFNLFYEPIRFFTKEIFTDFPLNFDSSLNLINVDTVARAIFLLQNKIESQVYHIVSPEDTKMSFLSNFSCSFFGFEMPKFAPVEVFDFRKLSDAQKILAGPFIPYCNYKTKFQWARSKQALARYNFAFPKIDEQNLSRIFDFCVQSKYMKKKIKSK